MLIWTLAVSTDHPLFQRMMPPMIRGDMFFLIGNGPLLSVSSARWMRDNLLGVIIPDEVLDRMEQARDQKAEGIRICVEQIQTLSEIEGISGTHLMAPINTKSIPEVISQTNIQNR